MDAIAINEELTFSFCWDTYSFPWESVSPAQMHPHGYGVLVNGLGTFENFLKMEFSQALLFKVLILIFKVRNVSVYVISEELALPSWRRFKRSYAHYVIVIVAMVQSQT